MRKISYPSLGYCNCSALLRTSRCIPNYDIYTRLLRQCGSGVQFRVAKYKKIIWIHNPTKNIYSVAVDIITTSGAYSYENASKNLLNYFFLETFTQKLVS